VGGGNVLRSIREHQTYLKKMYSIQNEQFDWDYLWGYLSRTTSFLFRDIHSGKATGPSFIKPISWLMGLSSVFDIDIEDEVLRRFPQKCPYCLVQPCKCSLTNKKPALNLYAHQIEEALNTSYEGIKLLNESENIVVTFEYLANLISEIYPFNEANWCENGAGLHIRKVQEEIAEIHEALSRYERQNLSLRAVSDEIADVLVWIISAWHIYSGKGSLSSEFIAYYKNYCPVCNHSICACGYRNERNQGLFDIRVAQQVLSDLNIYDGTTIEEEAKNYALSINKALKTPTDITMSRSVLLALSFMQSVLENPKISDPLKLATKEALSKSIENFV